MEINGAASDEARRMQPWKEFVLCFTGTVLPPVPPGGRRAFRGWFPAVRLSQKRHSQIAAVPGAEGGSRNAMIASEISTRVMVSISGPSYVAVAVLLLTGPS